MVELEDFKYGGTNITAFRLLDPNDELVQVGVDDNDDVDDVDDVDVDDVDVDDVDVDDVLRRSLTVALGSPPQLITSGGHGRPLSG